MFIAVVASPSPEKQSISDNRLLEGIEVMEALLKVNLSFTFLTSFGRDTWLSEKVFIF